MADIKYIYSISQNFLNQIVACDKLTNDITDTFIDSTSSLLYNFVTKGIYF